MVLFSIFVLLSLLLPTEITLARPQKLRVCVGDFPAYVIALDYLLRNKQQYEVSVSTVHACAVRFEKKYFDLVMADSFIYAMNYVDAPDTRIIALTNYSDGVDQVVGQKGRSVSELRGSRWALQRGSFSNVLLSFYLKGQGLSLRDVILEDVKVENTPQAIGKTRFHGVVNWQPYSRQAVARGGQVLATSADYQDKLFDFVVTRQAALDQYRPLIKAYLHERLVRARSKEQLYEQYAKEKKISVEHAVDDFQGVYIYDSASRMKQEQARVLQSLRVSAEVADIIQYSGRTKQEQLKLREKEIFDFSLLE